MALSSLGLVSELWTLARPDRARLIQGTFLRLSSDLVWLVPPFAVGEIINFLSSRSAGDSLDFVWGWMAIVIALAIYHFLTHDLAKFLIYQVSENTRLRAIRQAVAHLFLLDPDWHERENSGNKLQRIHKAGESIDQSFRMFVDLCIESSVSLVGVTLILASMSSSTAWMMLLFFLSYYSIALHLTRRASGQSHLANIEWEKLEGVLFESVNNISTIRALGFWKPILHWLDSRTQVLLSAIKKRIFWYRTRSTILNLLREFFRQSILFYLIFQVANGSIEVGMIATVLLYFQRVSESASEFSELSYHLEMARIAMDRFNAILETPPTAEISGAHDFPSNWTTLSVQNLSFAYDGEHPVLKDLSFTVRRGEKLGIVGLSGAGKSTLFKLLLKFYDRYEGSIQFEKSELRDIKRESYLKHFSYVPQETELFNLSLKDNITLALDHAADVAQFEHAIRTSHVKHFLKKLPHGVDSLIGEKGVKLSGGERQRVGIARAVYRNPEILFLDEATSHLDAESEAQIQAALHDVFSSVTALVIAHRLSTLKAMDRILVLEDGHVVEEGSFETLIEKKGVFAELWKKQIF